MKILKRFDEHFYPSHTCCNKFSNFLWKILSPSPLFEIFPKEEGGFSKKKNISKRADFGTTSNFLKKNGQERRLRAFLEIFGQKIAFFERSFFKITYMGAQGQKKLKDRLAKTAYYNRMAILFTHIF